MFPELDTIAFMQKLLDDDHSGVEKPAAIFIETVQADGGVYVFSVEYLKALREFCDKNDILMIVDDVQVGCSRTGTFFSFERAGIKPDMFSLSKSIGGYPFPMALALFKPEYDLWKPGEHSGTFRGIQLSMVAAKAGLEYMLDNNIEAETRRKGEIVREYLEKNIATKKDVIATRGIGLLWGVEVADDETAGAITARAFEKGLVIERAGRDNAVIKIMPPLIISDEDLIAGLDILRDSIEK
jgi:diaminobutyrate-2-oxoglutarate transaminase